MTSLGLGLGDWAGEGGSCQEEGGADLVHHLDWDNENIFPPTLELERRR